MAQILYLFSCSSSLTPPSPSPSPLSNSPSTLHNLLHWQTCSNRYVVFKIHTHSSALVRLTLHHALVHSFCRSHSVIIYMLFLFLVCFELEKFCTTKGAFACLLIKPSSFDCQKIHKHVDFAGGQVFGRWLTFSIDFVEFIFCETPWWMNIHFQNAVTSISSCSGQNIACKR